MMIGSNRLSQPSRPSRFRFLGSSAAVLVVDLILSLAYTAARVRYDVKVDAPKSIRDLLERHLDLSRYKDCRDITDDQLQYMVKTIDDQVTKLMVTEGYFVPKATMKLNGPSDRCVVSMKVEPGPCATVDTVALDFTGAITQDTKCISRSKKSWSLQYGMTSRQSDWDRARGDGLVVLQSKRYYAARQTLSQTRVDPDGNKADLSVDCGSSPTYTLGSLKVQGLSRYPLGIINHANPLRVGKDYSVDRLQSLQAITQGQPRFSNAIVDLGDSPKNPVNAPV